MRSSRARALLLFALGYVLLTWAMFPPLVANLRTGIPHDPGDPLLNTWILWWNARAVPFTDAWWNAPAFWPLRNAFALSEHLFGLGIISTPLQWMGAGPQLAYNILTFLSWPLSAIAAHLLCYRLTGSHAAGAIGGLVFGFNPYRLGQIPHLQVLACWWMPLALYGLHRALDAQSTREAWRWAAVFAAAWLLQALSNGYFLFYFSVVVACWFAWFALRRSTLRVAAILASAGVIASLLLLPTLLKYQATHEVWGLSRDFDEIVQYSAQFASFVNGDISLRVWPFKPIPKPEQGLYPGIVASGLVIAAVSMAMIAAPSRARWGRTLRLVLLAAGAAFLLVAIATGVFGPWRLEWGFLRVSGRLVRKPLTIGLACVIAATLLDPRLRGAFRARSMLAFYTLAAVLCFAMALGPYGRWNGERVIEKPPYWWLMKLPGLDGLRVPARWGMVAALPLAAAAALAFARLTRNQTVRTRNATGAVIALAITIDSWPIPFPMLPPPEAYTLPEQVRDAVVFELPMDEFEHELAAMYRAMGHARPLVNGSSGYSPRPYNLLRNMIAERDGSVLLALARMQPLCIVVDRRMLLARVSRELVESVGAVPIGVDNDFAFYRLSAPPLPTVPSSPVAIRAAIPHGWQAAAPTITDGRIDTFWATSDAQRGGEQLDIELAETTSVGGLVMSVGDRITHYPRRLVVELSEDRSTWTTAWEGSTAGLAYAAVVGEDPHTRIAIAFEPRTARFMRLRQTGSATGAYWSIAELEVRR